MPFGLPFTRRLCVVDNGDKPVPVLSDVKDHVANHGIGILKHAANFRKIVPPDRLDNGHPSFDFVRCIRVARWIPDSYFPLISPDANGEDSSHVSNGIMRFY